MSKAAGRKSEKLDAFHLLPPDNDCRIIYVKLNGELVDALRSDRSGQAVLYLDPDKHAGGEEIRIGEKVWKFEYKKESDELHHCISRDPRNNGIYKTVGAVTAKLSVKTELTGTVKAKIKKKSEESSQQKRARSQSAIHQDDVQVPSKKRKALESASAIDAMDAPTRKQAKQAKAVQRSTAACSQESESDKRVTLERLREEIMYALAVKDLSKDDLSERCNATVANFPTDDYKKLLTEIAEWDTAARVYKLRQKLYSKVYVELWPKYTKEEREQARARVGRGVLVVVDQITSREKANEYMEKYRSLSEAYLRLGEELQQMQQTFDELEKKMRRCEESGDEEGKAKVAADVMANFEEKKDVMLKHHVDFMRMHEHLKNLREAITTWKDARRGGQGAAGPDAAANGPDGGGAADRNGVRGGHDGGKRHG